MSGITQIIVGIIFLATIAVIFSNRSKTAEAITNLGSMFQGAVRQIVTPIR